MPKPKIKVNVLMIILKIWPILKAVLGGLAEAGREDSPGGKKITPEEIGEIVGDVLMEIGPVLQEELMRQNS